MWPLAAAGGWQAIETLMKCYIQADQGTQREAIAERQRLREAVTE